MRNNLNILIIIPARGGSKGIPRKNLRILNGFPLIYYSIKLSLSSRFKPDVYVTSDDEEILSMARKFGAKTYKRPDYLANDNITLDPVIFDAYSNIKESEKKEYDIIITVQPTSPLLLTISLDEAIQTFIDRTEIETILSGTSDNHLSWRKENNRYFPNFIKRLNRQELTPTYRETGGFLICRSNIISEDSRIGRNVILHELKGSEKVDIDNYEDWNICSYYLQRKKILFVVTGYPKIGLGHIYNTLSIADEIMNHDIYFLVESKSKLGYSKIKQTNFRVTMQQSEDILDDINEINPDVIINDRLDTDKGYINKLKNKDICVINFEDIGDGSKYCDLVINAMYPEKEVYKNHHYGYKYFILRNEFLYTKSKNLVHPKVKKVLLTFGGVDPNNFTMKVLESIYDYCEANNIKIIIAAGLGYKNYEDLEKFTKADIHRNSANLSDLILNSDIAFTSAGRTTFEIASIGVPAIVLCQNHRETTHFFASKENGFINLGLGSKVNNKRILEEFEDVVSDFTLRNDMHIKQLSNSIKEGKSRVLELIRAAINNHFKKTQS